MPTESPKQFIPDPKALSKPNEVGSFQPDSPTLDAASSSALRAFFELLDAWDREENTDEQ
jgi:hypothetical protein